MRYRLTILDLINNFISFVFGLVILGLSIRFFFRLFGADTSASVVRFIYNSTTPLLGPFRDIFPAEAIDANSVIEYSTLIAIVGYLIFAWVLTALIAMFDDYARDRRVAA